jgi:hypothetical protein
MLIAVRKPIARNAFVECKVKAWWFGNIFPTTGYGGDR